MINIANLVVPCVVLLVVLLVGLFWWDVRAQLPAPSPSISCQQVFPRLRRGFYGIMSVVAILQKSAKIEGRQYEKVQISPSFAKCTAHPTRPTNPYKDIDRTDHKHH